MAVAAADHPVCKKMGPSSTDDDPVLIDLKEFNGERFILQKPEQSSNIIQIWQLPMITQNPEAFFFWKIWSLLPS